MYNESIDSINKKTMRTSVKEYTSQDSLSKPEKAAIKHLENEKYNSVLDLGVGGGRTVQALVQLSEEYLGVDYIQEMVDKCKANFPGITFQQGDARNLLGLKNNTFDMIMFSMNGVSMVDHKGRLEILSEIYRLLTPGGNFLFSTYNQDNSKYKTLFQFPEYEFSLNPLKFGVRTIRFIYNSFYSILNRVRFKKLEIHSDEYSLINDKCHNYATMLYYISQENQNKQLSLAGFNGDDIVAFDLNGSVIKNGSQDDSIFYIVTKPI